MERLDLSGLSSMKIDSIKSVKKTKVNTDITPVSLNKEIPKSLIDIDYSEENSGNFDDPFSNVNLNNSNATFNNPLEGIQQKKMKTISNQLNPWKDIEIIPIKTSTNNSNYDSYPTDDYIKELKKKNSSQTSLSSSEIFFTSVGATMATPFTGVVDLFQATKGAITKGEWQSVTKGMWQQIGQYSSVDIFTDFLIDIRDKVDIDQVSYYMDAYEKKNYFSIENNRIKFNDGVEIYYNETGDVVIKNMNDIPYTICRDNRIYKYSQDELCLVYNADNQLIHVVDKDNNPIDFLNSLDYYGGSQMDFKNKVVEIVSDSEYLDIMQKYYNDATIEDVEAFSYALCNSGCGYVALADSVFDTFQGQEQKFQEIFGFPMYEIKNGKVVSNINYLTFDIALYRYKDLPIEEVYGNVMEYRGNILDEALGEIKEMFGKKIEKKFQGTTYEAIDNFYKDYLAEKNLSIVLTKWDVDENSIELYKEINDFKKFILAAKGTDLYSDKDGDGNYEKLKHENVGSHAMYITGIDTDGNFIVSSWGKEFKADLRHIDEVKNGYSKLWLIGYIEETEDGPVPITN